MRAAEDVSRWWIYQRERFPILAHGILIAAFSFSAVTFSALLRGESSVPEWRFLLVAFLNSFLSFLQLRIADEFKDFEEDSQYRPYRPVPRGLIQLRELGWLGVITAVVQAALAAWVAPKLLGLLLLNWTYLALMSREFFARSWLKARPITYLWTHMLIMPLIDFYATACDWLPTQGHAPPGLFLFVMVSFFNGVVIELGRKIRSGDKEEIGVQTYTVLWGKTVASCAWLGMLGLTATVALLAVRLLDFMLPALILWGALLCIAAWGVFEFCYRGDQRYARWFEPFTGTWTILLYLTLGPFPLLIRFFQ